MDNLRALNDRDGHKAVDQLLVRLGSLMRERCGAGEMAARVGGDEFALALLEDEPTEVVQEVEQIRGRFADDTGATLSVGICDGKTLRRAAVSLSLFEGADVRLVNAKKRGPGRAEFF
jgi:diguanylate cyclase (GGDEF)-like protein